MIGDLPTEVCAARNGADGVTESCGLEVKEVLLPIANIYWEETSGPADQGLGEKAS
jgi:hypothetical protein